MKKHAFKLIKSEDWHTKIWMTIINNLRIQRLKILNLKMKRLSLNLKIR